MDDSSVFLASIFCGVNDVDAIAKQESGPTSTTSCQRDPPTARNDTRNISKINGHGPLMEWFYEQCIKKKKPFDTNICLPPSIHLLCIHSFIHVCNLDFELH